MKNLTARLQNLTKAFGIVPRTAAIQGQTAVQIAQEPSQAIYRLGYKIIESSDRWIIDWSNPKEAICEKYMQQCTAKEMSRLVDAFQPIREFMVEFEGSAGEAASFGLEEFCLRIPSNIDNKDLQFYVSRVYPRDDINVAAGFLKMTWKEEVEYL